MSEQAKKNLLVVCGACGQKARNHRVLHEVIKRTVDDPVHGQEVSRDYHRFVQCMGCESLKYVSSTLDLMEENPYEMGETNFKVYPDAPGSHENRPARITREDMRAEDGTMLLPVAVLKMYRETIGACNAGLLTLAAGGLRATVEAICLNSGIIKGTLQQKIDELATLSLLTKSQAELLHEERYLGNAALHELETPDMVAIEDGLGIVEGLITTIYILPDKAKRLRERRTEDKTTA